MDILLFFAILAKKCYHADSAHHQTRVDSRSTTLMILQALGIHLHFSWITAAPFKVTDARTSAIAAAAQISNRNTGRTTPFSAEGIDGTVRPLADNVTVGKIRGTSYEVRLTSGAVGQFLISSFLIARLHQIADAAERPKSERRRPSTEYIN